MRNILLTTVCSVALLAAAPAFAQALQVPQTATANTNTLRASTPEALPVARNGEVIDSVGGGATEAILPGVQTVNGVSYITGGVGDEELAEMKSQEGNFNVRILLTSVKGEFMGETLVRILKDGTEILKVENAGPFFYTNLPAGKYTAEVTSMMGDTRTAKIVAPAKISGTGKVVIRFN